LDAPPHPAFFLFLLLSQDMERERSDFWPVPGSGIALSINTSHLAEAVGGPKASQFITIP